MKEKIIEYIDFLEAEAKQSNMFFEQRNDLVIENYKLQQRIEKAINIIQNDTTLNPQRQRERLINILQGDDNNE